MRLLPKILKYVDLEKENPLKLIDYQPRPLKKSEKRIINMVNPHEKLYEDRASFLLDDAVKNAQQIIEKAKKDAKNIINDAQEQKQKVEERAFEKGYDEGYKKGEESGNKEQQSVWKNHLKEFRRLRQELDTQKEQFKEQLQKECLKLSIHIAEKILHKKIQEDGVYFLDLINKGLEKAGEEKNVLVRVSPEDFEKVQEILNLNDSVIEISLLKDPLLSNGDCIIEGPHFEIDAGIKTQIQNITLALKELDVISDEDE